MLRSQGWTLQTPISRHCPHCCHRLMCQPRMLLRCLRRRSRISPKPCRHLRRRPHTRSGGSRHLKSARSSPSSAVHAIAATEPASSQISAPSAPEAAHAASAAVPDPASASHLTQEATAEPPATAAAPHESAGQAIRCRADNASRRQVQAHRPPLPRGEAAGGSARWRTRRALRSRTALELRDQLHDVRAMLTKMSSTAPAPRLHLARATARPRHSRRRCGAVCAAR